MVILLVTTQQILKKIRFKMNIINLNDDILIEIQKPLEIDTIWNLSLVHSVFYDIFKKYRTSIYTHLFKRKGYSQFLSFFIKSRKSDIYIYEFYKIDNLLRINVDNIISSFKNKEYVITRFILSNYNLNPIIKSHTESFIYNVLYYRKPIDEDFVKRIFVEIIEYRFSVKNINENTLSSLIQRSSYEHEVTENEKYQLRCDIITILNLLELTNFHNIMFNVSALCNSWDYWLRETGPGVNQKSKIYKLLSKIQYNSN